VGSAECLGFSSCNAITPGGYSITPGVPSRNWANIRRAGHRCLIGKPRHRCAPMPASIAAMTSTRYLPILEILKHPRRAPGFNLRVGDVAKGRKPSISAEPTSVTAQTAYEWGVVARFVRDGRPSLAHANWQRCT